MGKGGQKQERQVLPWSEISKHNSKEDRWLVIGGEVYDITNWSKIHPGGPRLIGHYAGQDATEAFGAFHKREEVRKYLKPLHIGSVAEYKDSDIDKDFRDLKQIAIKMGLFEPSYTFYTLMLSQIILLYVMCYFTLYIFGVSWTTVILSLVFHAIAQAQAGWLQHDFGHLSVFKNSAYDHFFHQFTMTFLKGASASWWNHMHFQHHAKPNVIGKDPDVRLDALFVVGDVMPVEVAKERKSSMPFNHQHKYFFALGPPLLFPVYFQSILFKFFIQRKLWGEMALCLTYVFLFFYLMVPFLGGWCSVAFYFSSRCLESQWFTWVAQSNHIPMKIKNEENNPWLRLQIYATCDITPSVFNDWFTGHLNFQIEHHLFPTMPRHNLYKIAPLVKSLCEKHNVPYIVKPLLTSFVDIYKSLKSSGELWEETYNQFHAT
ncbi:acyl-CoA 6-desaturase-like [Mya arenaria]|uniref:acyl-CoA 6-desaturase-like n=1 Tax=Mya arenaria TaxID=6604 RepID=UPI0022E3C0D0|nr:acyl-CoA 6-desaturase-like [Mya arenaria]XP_052812523.1 acyl-CoA 6-desaturase-like [Mya arenaria]